MPAAHTTDKVDLSTVLYPQTAGANEVNIPRPFTHKHYTQEDTSLNKTLWELFPVNVTGNANKCVLKETTAHYKSQTEYTPTGEYVLKSLETTIPKYERHRIGANLIALGTGTGNVGGHSMVSHLLGTLSVTATPLCDLHARLWADFSRRQSINKVDPLPVCVDAAKAHKESGNKFFKQNKWLEAFGEYARALFKLYPWACSPLIFSSDDAFAYGVAPLEGALWGNMSITALKIHDATSRLPVFGPTQDVHAPWTKFAMFAAEAVVCMRYATLNQLGKAYMRLSTASKIVRKNQPIGCPRDMPPSEMCDHLVTTDIVKALFVSALVSSAKGDQDAWAHAHCVTKHNGCGCDADIYPDWEGQHRVYKATPTNSVVFSLTLNME